MNKAMLVFCLIIGGCSASGEQIKSYKTNANKSCKKEFVSEPDVVNCEAKDTLQFAQITSFAEPLKLNAYYNKRLELADKFAAKKLSEKQYYSAIEALDNKFNGIFTIEADITDQSAAKAFGSGVGYYGLIK